MKRLIQLKVRTVEATLLGVLEVMEDRVGWGG